MIGIFEEKLREIEDLIQASPDPDIPHLFRDIPIDIFAKLLLDIPPEFPAMRSVFPAMATEDVQRNWTGAHGDVLLAQSVAFVRALTCAYVRFTGRDIAASKVLDYGCGWGRLTRLLQKFTSAKNIYAVDPWDESIKQCREQGIKGNLALSEWVPEALPFDTTFDLIFAFSVFTHLSERTTHAVLQTLRKYISNDGLLVITIRPKEFWRYYEGGSLASEMIAAHDDRGYAFAPPKGSPPHDAITYGDASISINYLTSQFPEWEIASLDYNTNDSYQVIVFLRPAAPGFRKQSWLRSWLRRISS